jgi:hypothetical protein
MTPPWKPAWSLFISARWKLLLVIAAGVVTVAAILLGMFWPFSRSKVLKNVQEMWPGPVQVEMFHSTWFPHPGFVAENVTFTLRSDRAREPLLATVRKVTVQTTYINLFTRPGHLSSAVLEGLRVKIPVYTSQNTLPQGATQEQKPAQDSDARGQTTSFASVYTQDAVLEVDRSRNQPPLLFAIHRLRLGSVRGDQPLTYEGTLHNPVPPGEIQASGRFGPWKSKELRDIPVSGSYKFSNAKLDVFAGIAGSLSSTGRFDGLLAAISAYGDLSIPEFELKSTRHPVNLKAKFQAKINGTNGDVVLDQVDASYLHTEVHANGGITGKEGQHGKTMDVNLAVRGGHIEDVLHLFVRSSVSPMAGSTDFDAHVQLPPGEAPFLKKVIMGGSFKIPQAVFTNRDTQIKVDSLSKRALGDKNMKDTPRICEDISGHLLLKNGIANFSSLSALIPGASVTLAGPYELPSHRIHLHGELNTRAVLSQQTTGIKSVLLKVVDPIFKRKHHGASVPVGITGTYEQPHFGIDIPAKK